MRDRVFKFANKAWEATEGRVGTAVIGAATGSVVTAGLSYLLNKSKRVQDLEQAQVDCKKFEEQVKKLEIINIESESFNRSLSQRNDLLRDELRQVDRHVGRLTSDFDGCRYSLAATQTAYRNSFCFWKQPVQQTSLIPRSTAPVIDKQP